MNTQRRVLKHMARDKPDYIVLRIDRDELIDAGGSPQWALDRIKWFGYWVNIKYRGKEIEITSYDDFEIDFNRMKYVWEVRVKK